MPPLGLTRWNRRFASPCTRLAGPLVLLLAVAAGCGGGPGGSESDCDPSPPCELSGPIEIRTSVGPIVDGTYEVSIELGDESVAFECTVSAAESIGTCTQTDRLGLDEWSIDLEVAGPLDAPTALVLDIDRGPDDVEPGPSTLVLRISREGGGFVAQVWSPKRATTTIDGRSCQRCWYELPEMFQAAI